MQGWGIAKHYNAVKVKNEKDADGSKLWVGSYILLNTIKFLLFSVLNPLLSFFACSIALLANEVQLDPRLCKNTEEPVNHSLWMSDVSSKRVSRKA